MALRAAEYYRDQVPDIMAPVIADRCGDNPFYITAVIRQADKQNLAITDEETLNKNLAVDISSGFTWGELHDQVTRWIKRWCSGIKQEIIKSTLYLSAMDENAAEEKRGRLKVEKFRDEINARGKEKMCPWTMSGTFWCVCPEGFIEHLELGGWFRRV